MTTHRLQCGSITLEIDPFTEALTFEDFLNVPKVPQLIPMEIPKIDVGPSFSSFGIPALDEVFAQIMAKLDLFKKNVQEFTDYLNKLFKNVINWTLALVGIVTVSQLIPVLVREITGLVFRWKRFHEWEKENADGNKPEQIPEKDMVENPEEIVELSDEDKEQPSFYEEEVQLIDEDGNPVFDKDGNPVMIKKIYILPPDISDYYDSIPEPDDLSEDAVSEEAELPEEDEMVKVDDKLIKSLMSEFDPQNLLNEENCEYLLDSGVYILHIKNMFLKRECIIGGVRAGYLDGCGMMMDKIAPTLSERYSHKFTIRIPNCPGDNVNCCKCHLLNALGAGWRIRVIPDDLPIWTYCECTCGANCQCRCHIPGEDAVRTVTMTCKQWSINSNTKIHSILPNNDYYYSDCSYYSENTTSSQPPMAPGDNILVSGRKIIRYASEQENFPHNSREWCNFCKVMYKYYATTCDFKLHKSETDVYIFFARGKNSSLFGENGKPILTGPATNKVYDYLTSRTDLFEFNQVKCKCDTQRPICTAIFKGWVSDVHTNLEAYVQGHAQTVKYLYKPDFDPLIDGDPWWYNDPHDYQSIKKRCIFEGILEHKTPEHVFRFYTYRKLTDKNWFPRLYKEISDALNKNYPDIPSGADEFKPLKTRLAWQAINKKLSDVVPIPEIYPELTAPEKPLFESRPEGWDMLESYGPEWVYLSLETPPALEPLFRYLSLLNKYYPGWKEFRDNHEPGWWRDFWKQIPDISGIERTTIFLVSDTIVAGNDILGEPEWWRSFWGPTIRDQLPDPDRPKTKAEVLAVMERY